MKKHRVTAKQLDEVMDLLRQTPTEPVGNHLTAAEFEGYGMKSLSVRDLERIDAHLVSCPECAEKMEHQLVRQMLLGRLTDMLHGLVVWPNPALSPKRLEGASQPWTDGQTRDGTLRWRVVEDKNLNAAIRFGSNAVELAGTRLRLTAGSWQRQVTLSKEDEESDQVLAEVTLTRKERLALAQDAELRVELEA